ncbi:hypothetical protein P7C70_g9309, partial [Phenoliferia sp. Uapishka_3]
MFDVSGNSVTAHYLAYPNFWASSILRFRASSGPYNNYLVDSDPKRGPFHFRITIHAPVLANLLRRYQGLYRDLLSGLSAPAVDITSEAECEIAEELLKSKPEMPEGWQQLGNEALAHRNRLDKVARANDFFDVRVEYALVTKLATDMVEPLYTWEDLERRIAEYKSSTAPPAPSFAQQVWSWVSGESPFFLSLCFWHQCTDIDSLVGPSKKSTPMSAPAAQAVTLEAHTTKQGSSTDYKMGATDISATTPSSPPSPPSYPSPPPYSPPRSSAVGTLTPGSPPRFSPKLLSPSSSGPTTDISKGCFTPVKIVAFLPPKEVNFHKAGTIFKYGPRTPPAALPLGERVVDFLTDHAGSIQIVLEALADSL